MDWIRDIFSNPILVKIVDYSPLNNAATPLNWTYLAAFVGIAFIVYLVRRKQIDDQGFASFIFPRKIYLHPDAITGYKIYVINKLFFAFLAVFILIHLGGPISEYTEKQIVEHAGWVESLTQAPFLAAVVVAIVLFMIQDFFLFFFHYVCHQVPALWEIHKVHHAPRVLTPATDFQLHPLEIIPRDLLYGLWLGVALGIVNAFIAGTSNNISMKDIFWPYVAIYMFWNFRHSHIPIYFPEFLTKIFVSPAYHQIHHSRAPEHWGKNMGVVFSIWDRWFGTYCAPKRGEVLDFGLETEEESARYRGALRAYSQPFRSLWSMARSRRAATASAPAETHSPTAPAE